MFLRVKLDQKANNSLLDQWGQRYTSSFNSIIIRSLIINIIPFPVNVYVYVYLIQGIPGLTGRKGESGITGLKVNVSAPPHITWMR